MDETTPLTGTRDPRRVLAGRYVLQGLLGQGGMADVELAYDQLLDRQVAVKILHQRYMHDQQFVARFRREAQAAASLNHPNVVAVYDTGEHEGRPYIVMEYVSGRSLKEVLAAGGVMPQRAAEVAGEAALALHYAHERNLVHRDVKPGNIMVSDEGAVKVTDFGIARAVGAESVTQTAAVFGTAAYVSPEQAQGEEVDRRTDVYALGCVLYEMLTGRQPFAADSAVALAYKHVSEDPVPPTHLNPDISATLEAVTIKAMAKDPRQRYQTARDLHDDLQRALRGMAVSAPPVVVFERTQPVGAGQRTAVLPAAGYEEPYAADWYPDEPARRSNASWAVITLLVLAGLAAGVFLLSRLFFGGTEQMATIPPQVVGMDIAEAERLLKELGFDTALGERQANAEFGPNEVITTDPPPGQTAPLGSTITLIYSEGPPIAEVPDLRGKTEEEAREILLKAGFGIGTRFTEASDEVDADRIIRSDPEAGETVEAGTPVDIYVSSGPATFEVPSVVNMREAEAIRTLENACDEPPCVRVVTSREFSDSVEEGRVIRQTPEAGSDVEPGSTVTIVVSRGPEEEPTPTQTPTPTQSPSPTPTITEPAPTPTPTPTGGDGLGF
ncbi:MAG TPA: Stk1 family PASTA domain-containing Ser/Thr kinase [Egibacteraceae bacterium]|nr:Stk1 family PASTA domain-containing Ser/Thr kinase [Egibacteraceae bacterium]